MSTSLARSSSGSTYVQRMSSDAVHTGVREMARAYLPQIRAVQPHGPYRLAGYCYGALVAYEMAVQLEALGETVELVAAINGPTVAYVERHDPGGLLDREQAASTRKRRSTPSERVRNAIVHRLQRARATAAVVLRRPLPADLRENHTFQRLSIRAQHRYRAERRPIPMLVLRATELYVADDLGCRAVTAGPVDCVEIFGPQGMARDSMKEPAVAGVADALAARFNAFDALSTGVT